MGTTFQQLGGVTLFFLVLNTLTVSLRILARTRLAKGAFGWDDAALLFTYIGYILFAVFGYGALFYGIVSTDHKPRYNMAKAVLYNNALHGICYIISCTVKISVALVLYRLVERIYTTIRWILILDIVSFAIFNTVTTLLLVLGCMQNAPYALAESVCESTTYAQEASYIAWDILHVILPAVLLWNIQMSRTVKAGVVGLFAVGLLAVIATVFRLQVNIERYHPTPATTAKDLWFSEAAWASTEHGLSLFASSILALKPVVQIISQSWSSLTSSLGGSKKSSGRDTPGVAGVLYPSDWTYIAADETELGSIGVRQDVYVDSKKCKEGERLCAPLYTAEVNGSRDSHGGAGRDAGDRHDAASFV